MQFEQKTEQISVMQSGACVLRARVSYVCAKGEGQERFNAFYQNAARAYLDWAQNKQGRILQEEYAARKSERMFGFRPMTCRLDVRVVWQNERFASVVIDSVRDSGVKGEYPVCHRSAEVWDMARGVILPAKAFLHYVPGLRALRVGGKRPEGLWVAADGVVLYHNEGAEGYAEYHTGISVDFVPRKGGGAQDFIPVLAQKVQNG